MIRTKTITTPGRAVALTIPLAPLAPACAPTPGGLVWFSDATGDFTEIAEAARLGAAEAFGPVLAVARALGETCGSVDWTTNWTPASGSGGDPAIKADGALLYVYQAVGTAPGELRVSAQCGRQTLGPISLTILPAPSGACCEPIRLPTEGPVLSSIYALPDGPMLYMRSYFCQIGGIVPDADFQVAYNYEVTSDNEAVEIQFVQGQLCAVLQCAPAQFYTGSDIQVVVTAEVHYRCGTDKTATLAWDITIPVSLPG